MITGSRRNILINASGGAERKHAITIASSQVSGTGTLTDFPVLITLDHLDSEVVDAGSNSALNGGGDLVFTSDSAGTTRLSCDIVNFVTSATPANRKCQIWVKVPSLSGTSDTTIYVWYKNAGRSQPASNAAYGSEDVWTSFTLASHDCIIDSSANQTITVQNAAGSVEYLDANTSDFDGSADYNTIDISTIDPPNVYRTIFFSLNIDVSEAAPRILSMLGGSSQNYNLQVAQINGVVVLGHSMGTSVASSNTKYTGTLSTGTWYRFAMITSSDYTSYPTSVYQDGAEITGIDNGNGLSGGTNNGLFAIAAQQDNTDWFDGKMAQVFASSSALSSDWIITDSNMINNPSTFASAGTPVDDTL